MTRFPCWNNWCHQLLNILHQQESDLDRSRLCCERVQIVPIWKMPGPVWIAKNTIRTIESNWDIWRPLKEVGDFTSIARLWKRIKSSFWRMFAFMSRLRECCIPP